LDHQLETFSKLSKTSTETWDSNTKLKTLTLLSKKLNMMNGKPLSDKELLKLNMISLLLLMPSILFFTH